MQRNVNVDGLTSTFQVCKVQFLLLWGPSKSRLHKSAKLSKMGNFAKTHLTTTLWQKYTFEKPISTFQTRTRISFFQTWALRKEQESRHFSQEFLRMIFSLSQD